jgi:hypothetical protein
MVGPYFGEGAKQGHARSGPLGGSPLRPKMSFKDRLAQLLGTPTH